LTYVFSWRLPLRLIHYDELSREILYSQEAKLLQRGRATFHIIANFAKLGLLKFMENYATELGMCKF